LVQPAAYNHTIGINLLISKHSFNW